MPIYGLTLVTTGGWLTYSTDASESRSQRVRHCRCSLRGIPLHMCQAESSGRLPPAAMIAGYLPRNGRGAGGEGNGRIVGTIGGRVLEHTTRCA